MVVTKVLCVAEKPSIAKAVAGHLGGGRFQTVSEHDESDVSTNIRFPLIDAAQHRRQPVCQKLRIHFHIPRMGTMRCHYDFSSWSFNGE